jgi:hypothetical protein
VDALDHAPGPLALVGDALHRMPRERAHLVVAMGSRVVDHVERAVRVADDRSQRLVQLVAQQRRHLAQHGQAGAGLELVLLLAQQLLGAPLAGQVDDGAEPAGLPAFGVDQRRLVHFGREALAVAALELGLYRCALGAGARQPQLLAGLVFVAPVGRPVGR